MYEMKDEYLLGIEAIDSQHRRLFELTEEAYCLLKNENMLFKCADIRKILVGIKEYTLQHFEDEEAYMKSKGYRDVEAHRKMHDAFALKVDEFEEHVNRLNIGTQDGLILELLDYLVDWLEKHICEEDRKYVD